MSHEDYLEHLGLYYSQKIKVLAKEPYYISCKGQTEKKHFTETDNDLTISCSNKESDILFVVTLSKNIHKENEIKRLLDNLNNGFDGKGYNFEVLNKFNLVKDYEKHLQFKQENLKAIEEIKTKYKEIYFNHITEKIDEFYKNRVKLTKVIKNITFQLKKNPENSKELRKKYVELISQQQKEFLEVQEFIGNINRNEGFITINKQGFNHFINLTPGKIQIVDDDYKDLLKPNKPKRESKKNNFGKKGNVNLTSQEQTCQDVMCKNEVYETTHKKDFRKWALKNHPDKKKGENSEENEKITEDFRIMSDCNDKEIWCPDDKKKPEKKKPNKQKPNQDKPNKQKPNQDKPDAAEGSNLKLKQEKTDPDEPTPETPVFKKKTLTINDFKEDMRVEWLHRGKTVQGTVDKINKRKKNKLMIIWDNGDNKEVEISKLKIIED